MDSEQLMRELTCPIMHELLTDPIALPCCGKAVSRDALRSALEHGLDCPLCRASLDRDAAETAPRNRVAQALLDSLSVHSTSTAAVEHRDGESETAATPDEDSDSPKLLATYCVLPVPPTCTSKSQIARLQLRVTNAARVGLRRVLCILVVDKSGSMSGQPWSQASSAVRHVVSMSRQSHVVSHVSLAVVAYESRAIEVDTSGTVDAVHARVGMLRAGGGTSFRGAFDKTLDIMKRTVQRAKEAMDRGGISEGTVGPMPHSVSIVFMTDGQAFENRATLADELRAGIQQFRATCTTGRIGVVPDVTVHAVGFSSGCDKDLLQKLREAGTTPGQFRYCEPGDSEDALCGRIMGMFEAVAAHGGCSVTIERLLPGGGLGRSTGPAKALGGDAVTGDTISTLQSPAWHFLGLDGDALPSEKSGKFTIQLRTKPDGIGTAVAWVSIHKQAQEGRSSLILPISVTCNAEDAHAPKAEEVDSGDKEGSGGRSPEDATFEMAPDWTVAANEDSAFASVDALKRAWVGVRIHVIAEDAIKLLSTATTPSLSEQAMPHEAVRLGGAILEHRLRAVSTIGSDAHDRIPILTEQLRGLSRWGLHGGENVSFGRLRDISSASAFSSSRAAGHAISAPSKESTWKKSKEEGLTAHVTGNIANKQRTTNERLVQYDGNNQLMNRNELQSAIMDWGQRRGADKMITDFLSALAVMETDKSGNTAVHLAAYSGQDDAIPLLVKAAPSFCIDTPNDDGETPVTIAIKRRGYHRTVEVLQALGGSIPADRVEGLVSHCIVHDFLRTAAFLKQCADEGALGPAEGTARVGSSWVQTSGEELPPLVFDESIKHAAAVRSRLKTALSQERPIDWVSLVRISLKLTDQELLEQGLAHTKPEDINPAWLFADCFPRKADALDIPIKLKLLETVLDSAPRVLHSTQAESGDTLLHRAVTSGSLPHVEFLVGRGLSFDSQNAIGNSPVHATCIKRYPCILDFFITAGADVNARNLKGMTPMAISIQMGSLRMVETLMAAGAMLEGHHVISSEGENFLHIAVRSNQPEILTLILDRVSPERMLEVDRDGFTPMLAAVEGDRKECLNILVDAAVDYTGRGIPCFLPPEATESNKTAPKTLPLLAWKMSESSALPGATALHVAAYYNRRHALSALLAQGANPNDRDGEGRTPLHVAAQKGDVKTVRHLISNGASPSAVDKSGRKPASYGRSYPDVVEALEGPLSGPLRSFAAGLMAASSVKACADIIKQAPTIAVEPGLFDAKMVLDTPLDDSKQTALMVAVSHGNTVATEALLCAGASPTAEDARGLSAAIWAQMAKSQKLMGAVGVNPQPLLPAAERHADAAKHWGNADAMAVFLGGRRDPSLPYPTNATSLHCRLVSLAEAFQNIKSEKTHVSQTILLQTAPRTGTVDRVSIAVPGSTEQRSLEADRWSCKIAAASLVASGVTSQRPKHVFTMLLATQHGPLVPELNRFLEGAPQDPAAVLVTEKTKLDFAVALADSLDELTSISNGGSSSDLGQMALYAIAPPDLPRSALFEDSVITLSRFVSATTDWSVALSALDTSQGSSNGDIFPAGNGVVLVISKSHSGRPIWSHSSFPEDREVMFPPGTRFRITHWQRSVQESGGRLAPEEIAESMKGNGSLVVMLEEIVSGSQVTKHGIDE